MQEWPRVVVSRESQQYISFHASSLLHSLLATGKEKRTLEILPKFQNSSFHFLVHYPNVTPIYYMSTCGLHHPKTLARSESCPRPQVVQVHLYQTL